MTDTRLWAGSVTRKLLVILVCVCQSTWGQQSSGDLTSRSLEDLMNVEVTSVSKKEQKLSRTPAAVFVITQDDIQQSGATNIPDLLRMVPGTDVAQITVNTWAITARGFNAEFSNKLLVLVDGRNVYTPTFGGVFWDVADLPLEDIEKIEVIRGPGGSVWGANAVNGVINIITKRAGETLGGMIVASSGNVDQGSGTVQYGGKLIENTNYRMYSKYFNEGHLPGLNGQDGHDGWHVLRGGFRTDTALSVKDALSFQGDMYAGREGTPASVLPSVTSLLVSANLQTNISGGYLQTEWNHSYSARSDSLVRISYDQYERNDVLGEKRRTFDTDFQEHFLWGGRQDLVAGGEYRYSQSHADGSLLISLNPASLNTQVFSAFVQDQIEMSRDRVYVTVGTKVEHNYYTGFGVLPTVRVTWSPRERHMFWGAVSRPLRTPTAVNASIRLNVAGFTGPGGVPALVAILGNPHLRNESLTAYEAGYRTTIGSQLSIDLAAYYNGYEHQETTEPAAPFFEGQPSPAHLVLPSEYQNLMEGEEHGLEMAAKWKVTGRWSLSPSYDFARFHMRTSPLSEDPAQALETEGSDPHVHARVRSQVEMMGRGLEWDTSVYFTDRLLAQQIPSYTRIDTGMSWQLRERVELAVFGQDLLRDHHLEFVDPSGARRSTLVKRSAYAKLTWRF